MWTGSVDESGDLPAGRFVGDHGDAFGLRVVAGEMTGFDWTDFGWVAFARPGRRSAPTVAEFTITDAGSTPSRLELLVSVDDTLAWVPDVTHFCDLQSSEGSPLWPFTIARWTMFPARDVTREG